MEISPFLIAVLAAIAAISFLVNTAMSRYIRIPLTVNLLYFAFLYLLIGLDKQDAINNSLMVRIGMLFLFLNISIGNYAWAFFLRGNSDKGVDHE